MRSHHLSKSILVVSGFKSDIIIVAGWWRRRPSAASCSRHRHCSWIYTGAISYFGPRVCRHHPDIVASGEAYKLKALVAKRKAEVEKLSHFGGGCWVRWRIRGRAISRPGAAKIISSSLCSCVPSVSGVFGREGIALV